MLGSLPLFYLLCNFGEGVAVSFSDISHAMYHKSWYLCSIELQKYSLLIMIFSRNEAFLEGFVSLHCSLETFKTVNGVFFSKIENCILLIL